VAGTIADLIEALHSTNGSGMCLPRGGGVTNANFPSE
jgi:hypothetical protein